MKRTLTKLGSVAALLLAGCTYEATVDVSPALDVYSMHETRVNGGWALAWMPTG